MKYEDWIRSDVAMWLAKIGGQSIGSSSNMEVGELVTKLRNSYGRPVGIVYSAPLGATKSLKELCDYLSLRRRRLDEVWIELEKLIGGFKQAWIDVRGQVSRKIIEVDSAKKYYDSVRADSPIDRVRLETVSILHQLGRLSLEKYYDELKRGRSQDQRVLDQHRAVIESLGERLMGACVMEPLFSGLSVAFGKTFIHLDPQKYLRAEKGQDGYVSIKLDVEASIANLASAIKAESGRYGSKDITWIMRGFVLGMGEDGKQVGCLPYDGSDLSAYVLMRAIEASYYKKGIDLAFVKHVDLKMGLPRDIDALLDIQGVPGAGKLVMDQVLKLLKSDGQAVSLFDPRFEEFLTIPVKEKVIAVA